MKTLFVRGLAISALLLCCASFAADAPAPGLDRISAWKAVENYNKDQDPTAALQAALKVAQANPTDDLGFMAISFCFYTSRALGEEGRRTYQAPAIHLLERHYIDDMRLAPLTFPLGSVGGKDGIALLGKVAEHSRQRPLRAQAAYWSAAARFMDVDDLAIAPAERSAIRADVTRLVQLVAGEYGDEKIMNRPAREWATPMLYALENLALGRVLPDAGATRIGGNEERLSDYRGNVVLLDFWATTCVPCVQSLPKVVKLKQELQGRPFEVITLSIDKSPAEVQDFMRKRMALPFVNWHIGEHSQLYRPWYVTGVPTYILVDEKGVIHGRTKDVDTLLDTARRLTSALPAAS